MTSNAFTRTSIILTKLCERLVTLHLELCIGRHNHTGIMSTKQTFCKNLKHIIIIRNKTYASVFYRKM